MTHKSPVSLFSFSWGLITDTLLPNPCFPVHESGIMSTTYRAPSCAGVQYPGHSYTTGEFPRVLVTIGVAMIKVINSVYEFQETFGL